MNIYATMREDIQTVFRKDPAARSVLEVLMCYPGLHSIWMHRLAHALWKRRVFLVGRFISHINRFLTGIEIHPGATIGKRFFVDHGSGVVIGETAEIGDDVHLYQGVVLGGVSLKKGKRHPTIGRGVMIGAGTIVLGPVTVGDEARIGAASLVIDSVPPRAVAVGVPARLGLGFSDRELRELTDNKLPDPIAEALKEMTHQIETLKVRLQDFERQQAIRADADIYAEDGREIAATPPAADECSMGGGI